MQVGWTFHGRGFLLEPRRIPQPKQGVKGWQEGKENGARNNQRNWEEMNKRALSAFSFPACHCQFLCKRRMFWAGKSLIQDLEKARQTPRD